MTIAPDILTVPQCDLILFSVGDNYFIYDTDYVVTEVDDIFYTLTLKKLNN